MQVVTAIIQPFMLERACEALREIDGLPGITVSDVMGWGKGKATQVSNRIERGSCVLGRKTKVEAVVPASLTAIVADAIADAARTGNVGDRKVFVHDLRDVVKIRTGERGESVL